MNDPMRSPLSTPASSSAGSSRTSAQASTKASARPPDRRLPTFLVVVGVVAGSASGCVVVDGSPPPADPYGDISFDWSFAGEPDCDLAGVDELDVVVLQDGLVVDERERVPCVGGGLTLTEYLGGRYEVDVDAYGRDDTLLYAGGFSIRVAGGEDNYAGVIVLDAIGAPPPPPPPPVGSAAFFWSFVYPTDEPIIDCALAGVDEVDVLLQGPAGAEVRETFPCADDGAIFDNLDEGRWTLSLDAFGSYHGDDLHLYGAAVAFDVVADAVADLGDVALERDEPAFADIEVAWAFTDATCASTGVAELTLAIQRAGLPEPEDTTTVACESTAALRRTFVPGSYTVSLHGVGSAGSYVGFATVDVAPASLVQVNLNLAPQ
jgi:hypothetical protein